MSMVKDQKTATLLVRDYLKAMGGEDLGHVMREAEQDLVEAIAGALAHARRESRPPLGQAGTARGKR